MSKQQPSKNSYSVLLKGVKDNERKQQRKASLKNNSQTSNDEKGEVIENPDLPDRSYGDYYCKICDSHMNSIDMWDAHVSGKRHIKNVEKGDKDSKYEDLPDAESPIQSEMKNVKDPIVGLSYIHEIRRKEPNIPAMYNCFLCHASIATVPLVTEHVLSLKHRLNYIKENDPEEYALLNATNLKKGLMEPLVLEVVIKLEEQYGRGTVKVKQEKQKKPVTTYSYKKTFNLNKDEKKRAFNLNEDKSHKNSRSDTNPGYRQMLHSEKTNKHDNSYDLRNRSRSPVERIQMHYDEEHSRAVNRRSFSERERDPSCQIVYERHESFSKKDENSKYEYNHHQNMQRPRNNDSNYEESNFRPEAKKSLSNDHLKSSSRLPSQNFPSSGTSITQSQSCKLPLLDLLRIISILPIEYLIYLLKVTLIALPEPTSFVDLAFLVNHITEIRANVRENDFDNSVYSNLPQNKPKNGDNIEIPGIGETSAEQQSITEQLYPTNFIHSSSTYTPSANAQQNVIANTFQMPPNNLMAYATIPNNITNSSSHSLFQESSSPQSSSAANFYNKY